MGEIMTDTVGFEPGTPEFFGQVLCQLWYLAPVFGPVRSSPPHPLHLFLNDPRLRRSPQALSLGSSEPLSSLGWQGTKCYVKGEIITDQN